MPDFESTYKPAEAEDNWYQAWEKEGLFRADEQSSDQPFSIVIPPPNVTGVLHVGHALNNTLQDILVRWKKMQGYNTLWLPGMDHAGIATQNVVEKQLAAEGTDRHQMGRDAFIERVWKWKEESGGVIIKQLKKLGASCDWSRERFTLDEGLSRAVRQVFVTLFEEGLIYRDAKIINWCPRCHTALSDLEVEYHDQKGHLYHVTYPFVEGGGGITVATTRPETIPGDTAVAISPGDERYASLKGRTVRLPVEPYREISIIHDDDVDPSFGTGALKITPAHDAADFEIGRRHNLESVKVIDALGNMAGDSGKYRGMERFEARQEVIRDIGDRGLLEKVEDYTVPLGHCYRCRTAVEPSLSPQWFVKVKPLAENAADAVREKRTRIIPRQWERTFFDWMDNIRDWCISRQIWWGHTIPAWYCPDCNGEKIRESLAPGPGGTQVSVWKIAVDAVPVVALEKPGRCPACGCENLVEDPDVLDTWFSSALWPFSTMGWPDKTQLLDTFYPTSTLVTGFDILFFWVARMMMMGLKFMGDVPFQDVYIHAMVRDAEGQKMSKSKGNVIDPLGMMEVYGTDAFRFTLAAMAAQGRDIKLSEERIAGYRNFVTKLWNAARLVNGNLGEDFTSREISIESASLEDRWILSRLDKLVRKVNKALEDYCFNDAASALYQFSWHEYCDWYLEIAKTRFDEGSGEARQVSLFVLRRIIALLHPLMPFVTEEIDSRLPGRKGMLAGSFYPKADSRWIDEESERKMAVLVETVTAVRTIRGEMNIKPSLPLDVLFNNLPEEEAALLREAEPMIKRLARIGNLDLKNRPAPEKTATARLSFGELFVPLEGVVDFREEVRRLEKELEKAAKEIARLEKKLSRKAFLERAPAEVVAKDRRLLEEYSEKRDFLEKSRDRVLSWLE